MKKVSNAKYYENNRAVILEKKKQKYQENREAIKRKYEESKEAIERRYGENKEVVKQKYQENRKVILDRKKQKYQENKEAIKRKYEESREMNKRRKLELSWDDIKIQFQKMILEGMTERCYCCDRLWYASNLRQLNQEMFMYAKTQLLDQHISNQFCKTCYMALRNKSIPKLCYKNGFQYPELPPFERLNQIEERLIAPRIPFMQIRKLSHVDLQSGLKGPIINIPINIQHTTKMLPRHINDDHCINVNLKRKIVYKTSVYSGSVRPQLVMKWLKYLCEQELYKEYDISIDKLWVYNYKIVHDSEDITLNKEIEDDEQISTTSILYDERCIEEKKFEYNLAPGENVKPQSLFLDKDSEELSFPLIFGGRRRRFKIEPTLYQIYNSEVKRFDRRGISNDHVLYMWAKLHTFRVLSNISIYFRQMKNESLTKKDVCDKKQLHNLILKDLAFLRTIPGSPSYWSDQRKKINAMIRQFGKPTLFITLSAAEIHWNELLMILYNLKNVNDKISLSEVDNLQQSVKRKLIQDDPVICASYFDHKIRAVFNTWKYDNGPFGKYKVTHYYRRIEFQHRGSPHVHMIIWLENAPQYSVDGDLNELYQFINLNISCKSHIQINKQIHRHSFTCRRRISSTQEVCRFGFPQYPMRSTQILTPIDEQNTILIEQLKPIHDRIKEYLELYDDVESKNFDDMLTDLNITERLYIQAIRLSLRKQPKVFLERDLSEININNYNLKIFDLMNSNMDIQYILNDYSCAAYVVDYINKPNRGTSQLLNKISDEINNNVDFLPEDLVRSLGRLYISCTEVSAQEAAWSLLNLHMTSSSEQSIFIPTFPEANRLRILKTNKDLQELEGEDTDIFKENIIIKYQNRDVEYESIPLIDFAALYDHRAGKFVKRTNPKIVRYVGYSADVDRKNFIREHLLLFTCWRVEYSVDDVNLEQLYETKLNEICEVKERYSKCDFDRIYEELYKNREEEYAKNKDDKVGIRKPEEDDDVELLEKDAIECDVKNNLYLCITKHIDVELLQLLAALNEKQREIVDLVFNAIRNPNTEKLNLFITGPAGCGKSYVIRCITEIVNKYIAGDGVKILLTAPTGKAAYNIRGLTLHNVFRLPTKLDLIYHELSPNTLNTLQTQLMYCEFLIIDEISMVGQKLFMWIHSRLCEIKQSNLPFGGVNVLVFGDFYQLPPIGDSLLFSRANILNRGWSLWSNFKYFKLTQIMRQKNEKFSTILTKIGQGYALDEDEHHYLNKRCVHESLLKMRPIYLYAKNKDVDARNDAYISNSQQKMFNISIDTVQGSISNTKKDEILNNIKNDENYKIKANNISYILALIVGMKYMITYNIDTSDGLVNGVIGILSYVEIDIAEKTKVKRIWFSFDDERIGVSRKQKYKTYAIQHGITLDLVPISKIKVNFLYSKKINVYRYQFPVNYAESITIHKSQGATYERVAVSLKDRLSRSHLYVGLSRVTDISGLYLLDRQLNLRKDQINVGVLNEYNRLESHHIEPLYKSFMEKTQKKNNFILTYHNVQSLPAHYDMIKSNTIFTNSDILLFNETHTNDEYEFLNFTRLSSTSKGSNGYRGQTVYIRSNLKVDENLAYESTNIEISYLSFNQMRIYLVYIPVNTKFDVIKSELDANIKISKNTIVVGDFNVDLTKKSKLKQYFNPLTLINCGSTTKAGTLIDGIFSNLPMDYQKVYTFFSHHDVLQIKV